MPKSSVQGFDASPFSAAVIGLGGLGCNIAVHLAGMGIGRLFLIDFDTVSNNNLNRQFLYTAADVGKPKALLSADRLSAFAPETVITAINRKILSKNDLRDIMSADIVFLAVDNNDARKTVQGFCRANHIPLVNGGIHQFNGSAYLYVPNKSPCLSCAGLTQHENGNILSVSSTCGIVGALEVQIGLDYLLRPHECEPGVLHIYDDGEIHKLKIKSQKNCEICGVKL